MVVDMNGNLLVSDDANQSNLLQICPNGNISTILRIRCCAVTVDSLGNVYCASYRAVHKIFPDDSHEVIAGKEDNQGDRDGPCSQSLFNQIFGIAVSKDGTDIFVSETMKHVIRRIKDGNVTTFAGTYGKSGRTDGPIGVANFSNPRHLCLDSHGNLFVADNSNCLIRKVDSDGNVTTFAGSLKGFQDGLGKLSALSLPNGLSIDSKDNIFVADLGNHRIRKITPDGQVTTYLGRERGYQDGREGVLVCYPFSVAVGFHGKLYFSDDNGLRVISPIRWTIYTHGGFSQEFRDRVRSVIMLSLRDSFGYFRHPQSPFSQVPKDLMFLMFGMLAELEV